MNNMRVLENRTLNIVVLNDSLFMLREMADGTLIGRSGLNYLIIETLALLLGFRYRLMVPKDKQYGLPLPNGTWNGAVGMLINDEADLAALSFYVTPAREKVVNFSLTINHDNIVHITRADSSVGGERSFLSQPFQSQVWLMKYTVAFVMLLAQILIRVIIPEYYFLMRKFSIWKILSVTIGLGSSKNLPKLDIPGVIILSAVIFIGSTLKMYGSTLASSVNLIKRERPFDTIDALYDAVKEEHMSLGYLETQGIVHTCLKTSKFSQLQEFAEHLEKRGKERELPFPSAFNLMMTSNYALIVDVQYFIMMMEKHEQSLSKVNIAKEPLIKINMAYAFGHSFKHQKLFNQALGRIRSLGLFDKFENIEMFFLKRDLEQAEQENQNKVQYIVMADMQYVILLFCGIWCSGFLLLILEYINSRKT